jgi:fructose/tagatose bisphosphate aldolase
LPLVTSKEVLVEARKNGYAVGAFNVFNLESVQAVIAAAEAGRSPAILQVWSGLDAFVGLDVLAAIVRCEA